MRTQLGKIFVFANVVLSLILATFAFGVYANRIDWGRTKEGPAASRGRLLEREELLKDAVAARDRAMARWEAAQNDLARVEKQRPALQRWYQEQLTLLETGTDAAGKLVAAPVKQLTIVKGQIQRDANGRPVMQDVPWNRPLQPLLDLKRLAAEEEKVRGDIRTEKGTLDALLAEEKRLTEEMNGDGAQKKGLRKQMEETQLALLNSVGTKEFLRRLEKAGVPLVIVNLQDVEGEHEYLMPLLYNRLAEGQAQLRRQQALEARLKELQAAVTTTARNP